MRRHQNNVFPITASVVSVNNQTPVGIKVTCFSPIFCFEAGYFLHLRHGAWRWPQKPE